jgi:LPS export ABC transporter protein LptC
MKMPNTRRIRQVLAVAIVAASVAMVAVIVFRQFRSARPEAVSKSTSPEIDMSLARLNFSEMRGDEKLWDLVAERADYDKQTGVARLTGVKAEIFGGKVGGMVITSETGSYLETQHLVKMQKKVHAVTKKGMDLTTEQLEYRTEPGLIRADRPVKVVDGRLSLTAQKMEMSLNDEKVSFKGTVDAVIEGYHAKH